MTVTAEANCSVVKSEMLARVNGQTAKWTDPARGGTYKLLAQTADSVTMSRTLSPYTDKMLWTLTDANAGKHCDIASCSESQVNSYLDMNTNYCNLRNMYCGLAETCCPVETDFKIKTEAIESKSSGAGTNQATCSGEKGGSGMSGSVAKNYCSFPGAKNPPPKNGATSASTTSTSATSASTSSTTGTTGTTGSTSTSGEGLASKVYGLGLAFLVCFHLS